MNRRQILIELAKSGTLTAERSTLVRAAPEDRVREALLQWGASLEACEAAGIPHLRKDHSAIVSPQEVQKTIDSHLWGLGLDIAGVHWMHPNTAANIPLVPAWEASAGGPGPAWASKLYPSRVSRVIGHVGDPEWDGLIRLIEKGVYPYGLSYEGFVVVDVTVDPLEGVVRALAEKGVQVPQSRGLPSPREI